MRQKNSPDLMPPGFLPYSKSILQSEISKISIEKVGGTVITKYGQRILSNTEVSSRYEIFDIKNYFLQRIDQIENNFSIKGYKLHLKGGIQKLDLLSDPITMGDVHYHKTFFLLSSSDKSRALRLDIGLSAVDGSHQIVFGTPGFSLYKKHIQGITKEVDTMSHMTITQETFYDEVISISRLLGERVMLSNIYHIITLKDTASDHNKFDRFKYLYLSAHKKREGLTPVQQKLMNTASKRIVWTPNNDVSCDAWWVFLIYLSIFSGEDCYLISKETNKILEITNCFIRNNKIDQILNSI